MRSLHVLLPMGGLGSRFADAGYELPKPLVPVDGVPMFRKALSSLDGWEVPAVTTAVLRAEHEEEFGLATRIRDELPGARVVVIEELTRGAVETCLAAEPLMTGDRGLLVLDCDLWFRSEAYGALVRDVLGGERELAAGLLTFRSDLARYSYAELAGGRVVRTAEKVVISEHALAGAWFFGTEGTFLRAARALLERNLSAEMPEFYLSLLYNLILAEGGAVEAAEVEDYASFGTPEELERYRARENP